MRGVHIIFMYNLSLYSIFIISNPIPEMKEITDYLTIKGLQKNYDT